MNVLTDDELRTYLRLYPEPVKELRWDENWWRIGVIDINKKHPQYRAGFGSTVLPSTRFVLEAFEIDQLTGCAIILLTGGKIPHHFAGWVPASREAEARRWVETLNNAIQLVLPPPAVARTDEHIAALRFESGSENAPDAPFGFETIELTESGALAYQRRRQDVRASVVGSVDPARFQQIVSALLTTTFPTPPQARFAPGASVVRITVLPSQQKVSVSYFEALRMDGYRDVVRELSKLVEALRDSRADILAAWKFSAEPTAAPV
jgi:hypothetical protein